MRYFKFKQKTPTSKALKNKLKEFKNEEKTLYRKAKTFEHIGNIVFWIIFLLGTITSMYLVTLFSDKDVLILNIIRIILSFVFVILCIVVSAIIASLVSLPFWTFQDNNAKLIRQTMRSAVCSELRDFYGLNYPVLVTKCYQCTNNKFDDHDVCLFFVDGELRITTNLQYGFYNINKDLGCYVFVPDEILLSRVSIGHHTAVELTAGDFSIMLGIKAKRFIERYILDIIEK